MGQFKPMVKMMTTEPSIELKLKKGGSVAHKKMKSGSEHGHKSMKHMMDGGVMGALADTPALVRGPVAPVQRARVPARPSIAARRRAMLARPVKKGGEVESKAEHSAEMKKIGKVESELKSHEGKKASTAHKGLKKGGKCYAEGGIIKSEKGETKMVTAEGGDHSPAKTGDVKLGNGGGYKTGGVVKGNGGGYATGGVALGNAGGFKKGGHSKKAFANGGSVNDEGKAVSMPQGNKTPSSSVSISRLSGTFKTGGKVTSAEGKLQSNFKSENATAMKQAKAQSNEVYSVYGGKKKPKHFVGGGSTGSSDSAYSAVMSAEKAGKKTMIDKPLKDQGSTEKKYPSGLTDADIDRVLGSKEMQEKLTHDIDRKRGGKVKK